VTKGARLHAVVVRAAKPYWTHLPASGDGAAKHGGRFNPIGIPALYTSFSFNTVAKEVRFSLNADPYTFYFLEVDSDRVVDLSDAKVRKALKVDWSELESPNWESDMHRGVKPASHKLARRLIKEGYSGNDRDRM
jgi:RES domain-containing protein